MKNFLWAGLLGLALLTVPQGAQAQCCGGCCGPWQIQTGFNFCFRISPACPVPQAGPWYLYWPMEAHFGPPAPTGYPYWPSAMTLPTQAPNAAPPGMSMPLPPGPPAPVNPTCYQPVGYFSQVPSYWYSR
jgi:hypothetical protein